MKMKKRAISLLLVFAMVTGLFVGIKLNVSADTDYELKILDSDGNVVNVDDNNKSNILGDGKVSFDSETYTLTLSGVNVNMPFDKSYIDYSGFNDLKINIVGTNTINNTSDSNTCSVIESSSKLIIEGKGTLNITTVGGDTSSSDGSHAIKCNDFEISSGTVNAESKLGSGIFVDNNITINGGTVKTYSEGRGSINVVKEMTISGGIVEAESKKSSGINVGGDTTISGGIVKAKTENGTGIHEHKNIIICGGTVEVNSGLGYGIYAYNNIAISGGTLVSKSERSGGIYASKGITISGGNIYAEGSDGIYAATEDINIGENINSLEIIATSTDANRKALNGRVINNIKGVGFAETTSTQGTLIPVETTGRTLNYKKVEFPLSKAKVDTAPTGKTLTYDGTEQQLVTPGQATGGTLQYALGTETEATTNYSTEIPKGKDVKTYYVWYKAVGDETHLDSDAKYVTSKINSVVPPAPTPRDVMSGGNQVVAYGQPASFEFDILFGLFQQSGKVYVDGVETDSKNYDAKPGSTIITLKDEFIKTLSEGAHEILVTVEGYEASTSFTVKKADAPNTDNSSSTESGTATASTTTPTSTTTTSKVTSPKTSDTIPIVAILILALGIGTIGIAVFKNRE